MTHKEKVQIRHKLILSHIIWQIALWIETHSRKEFLDKSGYREKDFQKMIDLEYDYTIKEMAEIATTIDVGMLINMKPMPKKE